MNRLLLALIAIVMGAGITLAARGIAAPAAATGGISNRATEPNRDLAAPTVVFLMRHAEKAKEPATDPPLSEAGRARAQAVAELLGPAGVTHLFVTEFVRTQETLAPLATSVGKPLERVAASASNELVAKLRALPPGSVAVVAGHSNTVPAIVRALGGTIDGTMNGAQGEMLPDDEYGRLIEVVLPPAGAVATTAVETLRLHVGAR